MSLTPIQHLAVKYLAGGWSLNKTAAALKVSPYVIEKWKTHDPEFVQAVERGAHNHAEMLEAMLLEGEAQAAQTLIEALGAERNGQPNWNARITAAVSLLDRAGSRGRAVEKQLAVQASARVEGVHGDQEAALRKALKDPGVRAWLKQSGQVESLVMGAEEVEAEIIKPEPASAPLMLSPPGEAEVA